jgi:threonine synthase
VKPGDRTVVVSTAHALKFTEWKLGYHEGTLRDVTSTRGNRPIELPADVDRVAEVIAQAG